MIIVEGPDGAGKTSLVQKLSENLEIQVAPKAVGGDTKSLTDVQRYVDQHLDTGFRREIFDRFALISGPIYSAFQQRTMPQKGFENFTWLSTAYARMREVAPLVIICLPPLEVVWQNCQRDDDNKRLFPNRAKLGSVYWLYFNLAARNPAMSVYDYTKDDDEQVITYVRTLLHNREENSSD